MPKRQYYIPHDFYNMKSDDELTILPRFKTRQHTLESACGPNALLMAMRYLGDDELTESDLFDAVHCRTNIGTRLDDIVNFLRSRNYNLETSIDHPKDIKGLCFSTMEDFRDFVIKNLRQGYPIIVETIFFGGHYQVIIGYDQRSTEGFHEDMLILADSSDYGDGKIDGYEYCNAFKFYTMWFDDRYLPIEHRQQPYIVLKERK